MKTRKKNPSLEWHKKRFLELIKQLDRSNSQLSLNYYTNKAGEEEACLIEAGMTQPEIDSLWKTRNPGAAWHKRMIKADMTDSANSRTNIDSVFYKGRASANRDAYSTSLAYNIPNPIRRHRNPTTNNFLILAAIGVGIYFILKKVGTSSLAKTPKMVVMVRGSQIGYVNQNNSLYNRLVSVGWRLAVIGVDYDEGEVSQYALLTEANLV